MNSIWLKLIITVYRYFWKHLPINQMRLLFLNDRLSHVAFGSQPKSIPLQKRLYLSGETIHNSFICKSYTYLININCILNFCSRTISVIIIRFFDLLYELMLYTEKTITLFYQKISHTTCLIFFLWSWWIRSKTE